MSEKLRLTLTETFTWTDWNGKKTMFNMDAMQDWCERHLLPEPVPFPPNFRDELFAINDVQLDRAMALSPAQLSHPPILLYDNEGVITADGTHRLWRKLGETHIVLVFMVPWDFAVQNFEIPEGVPRFSVTRDIEPYDEVAHRRAALAVKGIKED